MILGKKVDVVCTLGVEKKKKKTVLFLTIGKNKKKSKTRLLKYLEDAFSIRYKNSVI